MDSNIGWTAKKLPLAPKSSKVQVLVLRVLWLGVLWLAVLF